MSVTVASVPHGRRIDLEAEPPIPDGTAVLVRIDRKALTPQEKRRVLATAAGTWAGAPSLEAVFREIARRQRESTPRTTALE